MNEDKKDSLAVKEELKPEPIEKDWEFGITAEEARKKLQAIKLFQAVVQKELKKDHDYGIIPGTKKPTLLKPGAEKISKLLNLFDDYEPITAIERWEDKDPFFHYQYKCTLSHISTGLKVSSGIGSCNSKESKYRYRWVPIWDLSDTQKAMKEEVPKKQRGKYWFYRFDNDDIFSQVNTIMKMAKKRAHIDAALSAGRLSELFSQDLENGAVAKEPEEQAVEPITQEQTQKISKGENILTDKFGLMPEVMQQIFRTEFGAKKEIKDLTRLEAIEWIGTVRNRIELEEKKEKERKESKDKKAEEAKTDLTPHKEELTFVMKQYHDYGGKDLTQKEADEMDGAETLADYESLLKKWKTRRNVLAPVGQQELK